MQPVSRKASADNGSKLELVQEVKLALTLTLQTRKAHRDRDGPIKKGFKGPAKTEKAKAKERAKQIGIEKDNMAQQKKGTWKAAKDMESMDAWEAKK